MSSLNPVLPGPGLNLFPFFTFGAIKLIILHHLSKKNEIIFPAFSTSPTPSSRSRNPISFLTLQLTFASKAGANVNINFSYSKFFCAFFSNYFPAKKLYSTTACKWDVCYKRRKEHFKFNLGFSISIVIRNLKSLASFAKATAADGGE